MKLFSRRITKYYDARYLVFQQDLEIWLRRWKHYGIEQSASMVEWRSHLGKVGEVFTDAAASVHGGGGQEETAAAVLYDVYDVLSW